LLHVAISGIISRILAFPTRPAPQGNGKEIGVSRHPKIRKRV
jgi:hypothetical protein